MFRSAVSLQYFVFVVVIESVNCLCPSFHVPACHCKSRVERPCPLCPALPGWHATRLRGTEPAAGWRGIFLLSCWQFGVCGTPVPAALLDLRLTTPPPSQGVWSIRRGKGALEQKVISVRGVPPAWGGSARLPQRTRLCRTARAHRSPRRAICTPPDTLAKRYIFVPDRRNYKGLGFSAVPEPMLSWILSGPRRL
ncbi:hypothetical protein NDU88_004371 [Pleurodeles waltl]|uniref:Secreted protein n=1 Tax=Pleurodeles waltl TaxID=8319 RepID=A0AAV7SIL2_PLEWA|nr:hypothetical protein NDU88_004371 [Pleurodeles waltl]